MNETLKLFDRADPYVDDICVHFMDFKGHLSYLRATFEARKKENSSLGETSALWIFSEGEFVGHIISKEGLRPTERRKK